MFRNIITILLALWGFIGLSAPAVADELQEISGGIASTPDLINKGKTIYGGNCASCHGPEGKGDGPAAGAFNPKPRNFVAEKFKQGGSPSAVFHTVTNGMGSMPAFASMPVADRLAVVHYILSISPNKEKDTPESLAKIGLDPAGKPLAGFSSAKAEALPVEFIIERMATDGNIDSLNYQEITKRMEEAKAAAAAASAPVVIKPDAGKGEKLFTYCQACHGEGGNGDELAKAPQIAGQDVDYLIAQLKKFQEGVRGAHADDLHGLRMRPMSRILRSEEDVINVANYVSQLPVQKPVATLVGGDAQKGQAYYGTCIACHGADAKGMKAMSAPSLSHLQDWYVLTQLKNFKAGIRGTDPRDSTGATMRGMSMSIADDQAIKDLMAYIATLNK